MADGALKSEQPCRCPCATYRHVGICEGEAHAIMLIEVEARPGPVLIPMCYPCAMTFMVTEGEPPAA